MQQASRGYLWAEALSVRAIGVGQQGLSVGWGAAGGTGAACQRPLFVR